MESTTNISSIYQRPSELLQRLIRFDTTNPPGNEAECISYINGLLTKAGIETTILARIPERPNLIARLRGQGNISPLLLYGHVDVVTTVNQKWQNPPFEGKLIDVQNSLKWPFLAFWNRKLNSQLRVEFWWIFHGHEFRFRLHILNITEDE
ncbi:MAG: hypothetical protein ABIN18_06375, partial [Pseudomonadota bacterium]